MLTQEQILKGMGRNEYSGFYEPDFKTFHKIREKKYTIRLKLVYVEKENGDVLIRKVQFCP